MPKMWSINFSILLILFFLLLSSASSINITGLLSSLPEFSTFNRLLTETKVADKINGRSDITVLAVDDGSLSAAWDQPKDVIEKILSVHVLLDYYDVQKLQSLPKKKATVVTLFQASGQARGQEGFVNITLADTGGVTFAAAGGSGAGVNLVKSIAAEPYNLSVLQVAGIIAPFPLNITSSPSSSPSPNLSPRSAPLPSPKVNPRMPPRSAPVRSPANAPSNGREAPTASEVPSPSTRPGLAPIASEVPSPSTPPGTVPAPSDDAPAADLQPSGSESDTPDKKPSGAPARLLSDNSGVHVMLIMVMLFGLSMNWVGFFYRSLSAC